MIWTDTIQMVILIVGLIVMAGCGSAAVGGWGVVWERVQEGGRDLFFV